MHPKAPHSHHGSKRKDQSISDRQREAPELIASKLTDQALKLPQLDVDVGQAMPLLDIPGR
jgi:hypothetical protein